MWWGIYIYILMPYYICMKKFITSTLFLGLFVSPAHAYKPLKWRTETTYEYFKQKTKKVQQMQLFLQKKCLYFPDEAGTFVGFDGKKRKVLDEYMQLPLDTFLRGGGDCEDLAALAADWLCFHGYETKIIAVFTRGNIGHAVCAFKEGKKWSYIDQGNYKQGFSSLEDLARSVAFPLRSYDEMIPDQQEMMGYRNIWLGPEK